MPQLNFAWWFINFIIGWVTLIILITIITNKSLTSNSFSITQPSAQNTSVNNWSWN
uniref:ATP synthase complex subunit 8 n=1 Tax=Luidia quinaria TaxID=60585 RepID=Q5KSS8_9ECHI|nr:ATP synthase F0 subunit 8 [Luidia quinaria]BAD86675.1 ATPase subunit 8 [Luidia quinaria]